MTQFQGDRDSRGPVDFAGTAGGRYDDDGDDNDEDDDDDPNRRPSKRKASKLSMPDIGASNAVSVPLFSPKIRYLNSIVHLKARLPSPCSSQWPPTSP